MRPKKEWIPCFRGVRPNREGCSDLSSRYRTVELAKATLDCRRSSCQEQCTVARCLFRAIALYLHQSGTLPVVPPPKAHLAGPPSCPKKSQCESQVVF